ncbi:hypothetical protein BDB00DRAFT_868068 [Zychaea mexicana]|uniref:uncharacterized protein n=1 Tax=Zychaea mexicana TaxID=64656 RepID=UPI0022FDD0B2|nr:uncharacterized protein BDB00DRAFT_868068 [Zychaea mexicana]KAI9497936.1 hypothetical protein BDB00DRAFT_868068 [Zychaea mexicana]
MANNVYAEGYYSDGSIDNEMDAYTVSSNRIDSLDERQLRIETICAQIARNSQAREQANQEETSSIIYDAMPVEHLIPPPSVLSKKEIVNRVMIEACGLEGESSVRQTRSSPNM